MLLPLKMRGRSASACTSNSIKKQEILQNKKHYALLINNNERSFPEVTYWILRFMIGEIYDVIFRRNLRRNNTFPKKIETHKVLNTSL